MTHLDDDRSWEWGWYGADITISSQGKKTTWETERWTRGWNRLPNGPNPRRRGRLIGASIEINWNAVIIHDLILSSVLGLLFSWCLAGPVTSHDVWRDARFESWHIPGILSPSFRITSTYGRTSPHLSNHGFNERTKSLQFQFGDRHVLQNWILWEKGPLNDI